MLPETGTVEQGGYVYPFKEWEPDPTNQGEELWTEALQAVCIAVWPHGGYDEGVGDDDRTHCVVEVCAFFYDENQAVPLIDVIKGHFTGESAGPNAEIIALGKLKAGIDEIIANLKKQVEGNDECREG